MPQYSIFGEGQHDNYHRCRRRHRLQSFVMIKETERCNQISNGWPEKFTKITLLTVTVLFLFALFNLILDAPRMYPFFTFVKCFYGCQNAFYSESYKSSTEKNKNVVARTSPILE